MAISGNGSISIRKKDLQNQKGIAIGMKKLVAYHKATLGDASINLSSLSLPSAEMPSATNPTAAELQAAKLLFNSSNLTLVSSSKGVLMEHLSYKVASSTLITFEGWTAEDGEIFTIIIDPVSKTGLRAVDASPLVATGTLSAGSTDFNVGVPFELNKYPNDQIGAVLVFLDGILQFRNVGNVTAAPTADGNYEEVNNGGSTSILIRFNSSDTVDREVVVISNGLLVDRPDDSRDAVIETQQATIDQVVEDLAAATGNPESRYQASPSQADLKQFGNRVFDLEDNLAEGGDPASGPVQASTSDFGAVKKIKWQRKDLTADFNGTGVVSDLTFNNLEIGKTYRVTGHWYVLQAVGLGDSYHYSDVKNGSTIIGSMRTRSNNLNDYFVSLNIDILFVATATTLTFEVSNVGNSMRVDHDAGGKMTFAILEELPNHEQVSSW